MNEQSLKADYEAQKPMLDAWGAFVCSSIVERLQRELPVGTKTHDFLKIPPKPRVKDTASFLSKAIDRGKPYKNPLHDITDKVGVRFVVLLRTHVDLVCRIVEDCDLWSYSKDRDAEEESRKAPQQFSYQSHHFVIRSKQNLTCGDVEVPASLPCEIQIRTLLQHAYSEMTHDTVYKPKVATTPEMHRQLAKSSALVEIADDLFRDVDGEIRKATEALNAKLQIAAKLYQSAVGADVTENDRISSGILDAYSEALATTSESELHAFLQEHDYIPDKIRARSHASVLYQNPCILWVYWLVDNHRYDMHSKWPFDQALLDPILTDLGISSEVR